ncbi:MAG: beta-ketoacyl-ACP synthase II [Caldilineales bacterium]|nr:beta-ketoacyl-ACP synthase II [Caldilineales bacterium]
MLDNVRHFSADAFDRALESFGLERIQPRRRVVITGIGAITSVGHNLHETWQNLAAGQSGVDYVTLFDASAYPTRIAAEVKDWDPTQWMDAKEARRIARCSQFAIAAANQALQDAGLPTNQALGERTGVILGTGLGGLDVYQEAISEAVQRGGTYRIRPTTAVGGLPNIPAFHISLEFGASGPLSTIVTACAAGTQSIGEATESIRRGAADCILAGGVEALIGDLFFASFSAMKAISTRNDPPQKASRPFDALRDGFIIGEGAAVLVLEEMERAVARGARIYAEVLGHSASADAYHVAAPEPDGLGAQRAMRWALLDAGIQPEDVNYINTHGSSTPLNDKTETHAIKQIFGEHAYKLAINSTKSMVGHAFGGAGAIEALATTMTVYEDRLHPTINYEYPDPDCDLDCVPNESRRQAVEVAMSNSFGLGGQNACLVFGKFRG